MNNSLFDFKWLVISEGFQWTKVVCPPLMEDNEPTTTQWLIEPQNERGRTSSPMRESTGLYLEFAELAPKKQPILDFANRFGLLGTELIRRPDPMSDQESRDGVHQVIGEDLEAWKNHILVMKDVVEVWDLVARRDTERLIEVQRARQLFTDPFSSHRELERALVGVMLSEYETYEYFQNPEAFEPLPAFDETSRTAILRAAKSYVMNEVNEHLLEAVVTPRLVLDSQAEPRFFIVPRTLLGAMWLQFAEAISHQKEYRRCRNCHAPFEISAGRTGSRSDSTFCAVACKTEFHNQKRRDARRLRSEGKSLREIAARYKTTIPAVKKWVGESETKKKTGRKKR